MAKKAKKVNYELIDRKAAGKTAKLYKTLDKLIAEHHDHLKKARICLAWHTAGWNPDADGHMTLAKTKKATDLDRLLHDYDFVIMLSKPVWDHVTFLPDHELAILDHALCHAAVVYDDSGRPRTDENGRTVYRTRKHDIEEFHEIVARHGIYRKAVDEFIKAALEKGGSPLFPMLGEAADPAADPAVAGSVAEAS
jgi:hypothetical protein